MSLSVPTENTSSEFEQIESGLMAAVVQTKGVNVCRTNDGKIVLSASTGAETVTLSFTNAERDHLVKVLNAA